MGLGRNGRLKPGSRVRDLHIGGPSALHAYATDLWTW